MISGESDFQTELKPHEQIDILKNNGRKIIQNKEKFMFGIDAYLLAGFSEIRKGDIVVEFGTGTGIIPILLADSPAKKIHALEVQPESVSMARRSVELNELSEKIQIHEGNLKNASQIFSKSFCNTVISNPPYIKTTQGKLNPSESKNIARHEILCTLEDVISSAEKILKSHGRFFMIHRSDRLDEIFILMEKHSFKIKRLQFVFPFIEKPPVMILVEARKNANNGVKVLEPLIMYDSKGIYSKQIEDIYKKFTR